MTETDSSVDPHSHQAQNSSGENCPCPGRGRTGTPSSHAELRRPELVERNATDKFDWLASEIENTLDRHKFAKLIRPLRELASEPRGATRSDGWMSPCDWALVQNVPRAEKFTLGGSLVYHGIQSRVSAPS